MKLLSNSVRLPILLRATTSRPPISLEAVALAANTPMPGMLTLLLRFLGP